MAAFLAACTPATVPQSGSTESSPSEATIELSVDIYNYDPYLKVLDQIFTDYMAANPNIAATVESAPWEEFWARQEARLAAGNPTDISIGDPAYVGRYAHKGYYLNVEPFVEAEQIDLSRWIQTSLNDCRYDNTTGVVGNGTLFGFPANFVGSILYYNKDIFDAAGVAYPDDTWDRNTFLDAALALTLDEAGVSAAQDGFDHEAITQWGIEMIGSYSNAVTVWNNGGELINREQTQSMLIEPATVEAFEWLASLLHEHYVHPTPAQMEGLPNPFQVARVAMTMDGSWNVGPYITDVEFNWDIAPVPMGTAGIDRITYAGTDTFHVFKASKNVDAAWALLQYMVGPEGMKYFATTGTPCLLETANSEAFLSGPPEHRAVVVELGSYAVNYYPGLKSDQWKQIYDAELQRLWLNEAPALEVLQGIHDQITPILETPISEF
jgi:multiple sugar transport system substrate-binding protein